MKDETALKCSEINVKEPKTWAWVAAIITSLLLFFVSFSVISGPSCAPSGTCTWTFFYSLVFGLLLLAVAFLCILRCCACSKAFATKVTPYTQNYWFKTGLYYG